MEILSQITELERYIPLIRTIIIVIVIFLIISFIISLIKKGLLKKVKSKKQRSNVKIFSKILKIILFIGLILIAFSSYYQTWTGLAVWAGLFSAALGWALQRPITGIAAWIMVVTKRP
ncbi:MAG: mechanosensitive ion channel, partial [Nanoarchaeota archaeon]|nr:mechanosensitive ion channel [Nanoarchaeota archaeon]